MKKIYFVRREDLFDAAKIYLTITLDYSRATGYNYIDIYDMIRV